MTLGPPIRFEVTKTTLINMAHKFSCRKIKYFMSFVFRTFTNHHTQEIIFIKFDITIKGYAMEPKQTIEPAFREEATKSYIASWSAIINIGQAASHSHR